MKKPIIQTRFDLMLLIVFIVFILLIILDFVTLSLGATMTAFGLITFFVKSVVASFIFDYFFEDK